MKKLTKYSSFIARALRALSEMGIAVIGNERRDIFNINYGTIYSLVILMLLSLLPGQVFAAINCTANFSGRTTYVDYNVPIITDGVQISVLKNKPIGDVIWNQVILNPDQALIGFRECFAEDFNIDVLTHTYFVNVEGGLPAIVGQWRGFDVYDTGITGIGLVIRGGSQGLNKLPYVSNAHTYAVSGGVTGGVVDPSGVNMDNSYLNMELLLIKTGDIPTGVWNIPIVLPAFSLHVDFMDNASGPEVSRDYSSRFMIGPGSINIVGGTCQTPDVNVTMGRHSVSADMEHTPWVDFAIELNNCPPMFGTYTRTDAGATESSPNRWEGPDNFTVITMTPNTIGVLFTPAHGFNEMLGGESCANIAPTTDAASGVCLEIQNALNIGVLEQGAFNLPVDSGLNLLGSVANYSIPLKARYVRTADSTTMTPGRANSAVEFTINYY